MLLGAVITCSFFLPTVFQVAGNTDLTIWERLERITVSIGQTAMMLAAAATPGEVFQDRERNAVTQGNYASYEEKPPESNSSPQE